MRSLSVCCRAAAVLACLVACAAQAPAAFAANTNVNLTTSKTFSPANVTIAPGDSVTWTWTEVRSHNVTSVSAGAETIASGTKSSGTYVKTFNTPGTYAYHCTLHSGMNGSVTVSGGGTPPPPPPPPDTTPPPAPTGFVATAADGTVTLDWNDSSAPDLANYVVERRVGTGAWSVVASPTASVYTDVAVTNGTTYSYRVTAVDATGNVSASTSIASATPVAPPPVSGPVTRHVAIGNYTFAPTTITIKTGDTIAWDWSGPDVNHSVTSSTASEPFDSHLGIADNQISGPPASGFSHTFNTVGTYTYFCRVHVDMVGTINVTTPPATPDTTAPAAPAAPVATAGDASVTIDWADSAATDLSNYVVQRQTGGGAWTTVGTPVASVFIDSTVVNGTAYSYRVTAVDTSGNVSAASTVVVATPLAPPPPPPGSGPLTRHVNIGNYSYSPSTVTVNAGDTVEWDWTGPDVNHSVTTVGGLLESLESHLGALVNQIVGAPAGGSYSHLFTNVGTYAYYCRVHPDMTGTVRVVASGAPANQPADPPAAKPAPAPPPADVKPARAAKTYDVKIANYAFAPANVSIRLGDVVRWSWTGTDTNHSVTSTNGQAEQFESHPGLKIGEITKAPAGGSFSHTFTHEGVFTYFCRVHPGMTGKVTVGPAPVRVRIVRVKRGSGSLRVSYRLTKPSAIKAMVYKAGKRVVTKTTKGRSGANSVRIVLPRSARKAALRVVLRSGTDGTAQARASVRAVSR